jgi:HCOMODA/2-hydroxy-3-carboxy-muconic semialdehyde decarboxylase
MSDKLEEALSELVLANHILANEGVLDGFGHVSMRAPDDPENYFLSRARAPELVEPGDLVQFTLDGDALGGRTDSFYSERVIHGEIYRARPDVMAVCHNHAEAILPYCVTGKPLRPVFHLGSVIGANVPLWDSQDDFGDTSLLVVKPEEGRSLARTLGENFVVLMRGHGATVAGRTLREAVFRSIYMAANAAIQLRAAALGDCRTLTPGEVRLAAESNLRPFGVDRAWERWKVRASS